MNRKTSSHSGSVLIITLVFLVLMAILIVGTVNLTTLSRSATHTHLEKTRAALLADSGVQQIMGTLQQTTTDTNRFWVSQPGQLWAGLPTNSPATTYDDRRVLQTTPIPLSSGQPTALAPTDAVFAPCNLNIPDLANTSQYLVSNDVDGTGATVKMGVDWVYVRSSGALDTNEAPVTSNTSDPIVGRYAYWADDESGRINCNTAWGRTGNTNVVANPTFVDPTALPNFTSTMASQMHQFVTTTYYGTIGSFFNTPEDTHRVNATVSGNLSTNLFSVTHYNSDPSLGFINTIGTSNNLQGRPILLTTNPNLVPKNSDGSYAYRFLDILTTGKTDPGLLGNLDPAKLPVAIQMLLDCLTATNWPMAPGSSFQQKYYPYDTTGPVKTRYLQLALNIIDYVRCRESKTALVSPLRAAWPPTSVTFDAALADYGNSSFVYEYTFMGHARTPCITEIGVWVSSNTQTDPTKSAIYQAQAVIELYLPPNYGLASVDLKQCGIFLQMFNGQQLAVSNNSSIGTTATASPSTTLTAGNYVKITTPLFPLGTVVGSTTNYWPTRPANVAIRVGLTGPEQKLEIVPTAEFESTDTGGGTTSSAAIPILIDPLGPSTPDVNSITSVEVDDPRVNRSKWNWTQRALGSGNSFGSANTSVSTIGKAPTTVLPQQDTDASGNISAAGLYMPPPAGSAVYIRPDTTHDNNTLGIMTSVAELGTIPTGDESDPTKGQVGVPWRTLRLQPNSQGASVVPDWALLGLFAVPTLAPTAGQPVLTPHGTSIGGRVNINAMCQPFAFARIYPLAGLFQGAQNLFGTPTSTISATTAQTVASNIAGHLLATNGKDYGFPSAYYMPGEISEISGVADQGEASEQVLRQTMDMLTVNGNVYRVYSVGQAIQQTPGGTLKITGEQRVQVLLERWLDNSTSSTSSAGIVKFKTLYYGVLAR